jgi:hypothetical protein
MFGDLFFSDFSLSVFQLFSFSAFSGHSSFGQIRPGLLKIRVDAV